MKKKIVILSAILTLLTIFFDTFKNYDILHGLGLPFNFLWYSSNDIQKSSLDILNFKNLTKVNFRIDLYFFSSLINFLLISFLYMTISKIINKIRHHHS